MLLMGATLNLAVVPGSMRVVAGRELYAPLEMPKTIDQGQFQSLGPSQIDETANPTDVSVWTHLMNGWECHFPLERLIVVLGLTRLIVAWVAWV